MRYEGNKVVLTESELRWLVNESVKNTLNEVGNWAGVKNAWNGLANGKFNVKKSFQTGKQAQTFQKYYNNAQKSITGMQQVLNNSDQGDLAAKVQQINGELQQAANGFQQRAAQASGRQAQPQNNTNTAGNTAGNGGAGGNVAKTIQMNPNAGQNTENGQQITQAGAAANVDTATQQNPTDSFAAKMGRGVGNMAAGVRNFTKGIGQGYRNNKVQTPQAAAPKPETPQAAAPQPETPQAAAPQPETPQAAAPQPETPQAAAPQAAAPQPETPQEKATNAGSSDVTAAATDNDYQEKLRKELAANGINMSGGGTQNDQERMQLGASVAPRKVMPESRIRVTQNDLRRLVSETVNILLSEEGEAGGGGATNCAGTMQGGGTNPGAGQYDVPAFAKKSKKKVGGNAFSEPIMRQGHNLGDVTSAPANKVDMSSALSRPKGGIAMGGRVGGKKK